jgi:hypothetical protein
MKTSFIFFFAILSLPAFSQIKNFRIGIEANYALIPSVESKPQVSTYLPAYTGYSAAYIAVASLKESYSSRPGLNLRSSFELPLTNRFYLKTGLTFSCISYQRSITIEKLSAVPALPNNETYNVVVGSPFSSFYGYRVDNVWSPGGSVRGDERWADLNPVILEDENKIGKTTLINLQVPILVGTTLNKGRIGIHAGAVTSVALYASAYKLNSFSAEKTTTTKEFTPISFGAMAGLSVKIFKNFSTDISGQYYFSSLYKEQFQESGKARMNLLSAGISYQLN